jgi:hypothetical protein
MSADALLQLDAHGAASSAIMAALRLEYPWRTPVERRSEREERRKVAAVAVPAERRTKLRRRTRKFYGSPPAEEIGIDITDEDVVRYWAQELGVTADELRSAAQNVGASVKALREHFGK